MNRMTKLITAAVLGSLLVVPLAGTAYADPPANATGTVAGVAEIGKYFDASDPCDKSGVAIVRGRGLYFPGVDGQKDPLLQTYFPGIVAPRENRGVYQLSGNYTKVQLFNANKPTGLVDLDAGVLHICGYIAPVAQTGKKNSNRHSGLGAACDDSKGHHGQGQAISDLDGLKAKVFDVGWESALGGLLPVRGRFTEYEPGTSNKKKSGEITALVRVGSAANIADCAGIGNGGNGAQTLEVTGVFELVNGAPPVDVPNLVTPFGDDTKKCKGTGTPPNPGGDPNDKAHEGKGSVSPGKCPTFKPEPPGPLG